MSMGIRATISVLVVCLMAVHWATGQVMTIDEKVRNLNDLVHRNPILKINMDRWKSFVRQQPRNYSIFVMFTALSPGVNCPICRPAYEEFQIVANSHRYSSPDHKGIYFAVVDYEEAPQVFQQMNLNTAPVLYHFSAKLSGKKKPDQMDFQRHGYDADAIGRFIADTTEVHIRVLRPPNYAAPVVIGLLVCLVLGFLYMKRNNLEFLYNKTSWGIICLAITFVFLSGQMWNHIRGPPFIMTNPQTRESTFIHGSTQFQLVAETYIVMAVYATITFGFILLNDAASGDSSLGSGAASGVGGKKKTQQGGGFALMSSSSMAMIGLGLVFVFFSLLLSIFRAKYRGYPYSLLFS